MDERAGTGAVILARRCWTLFLFLSVIFWCPLHVLVRRPSLRLHSCLCAELTLCGHYEWRYCYRLLTFCTPYHHLYAMKAIDLL
jgi:hypothetical protein